MFKIRWQKDYEEMSNRQFLFLQIKYPMMNRRDIPLWNAPALILKIFFASPKIIPFQIHIFVIGFLQDLFLIGKFQKMISFMKFVIP